MDTATTQPGDLTVSLTSASPPLGVPAPLVFPTARPSETLAALTPSVLEELWHTAQANLCDLTREEFAIGLCAIGERSNYNLPPSVGPAPSRPSAAQQNAFFRSLHLPELALAQACALGRDRAWQRFLELYRVPLTHAAIAITGSATLGHELADTLYAELFGLSARDGLRRSPLASYSGRGSLMGWLRSTLAQRHVDHHRRTHREFPLETIDHTEAAAAPELAASPRPANLTRLSHAVERTLAALDPESRFLLSAYFLDQQTLLQLARLLRVHEATISRRLKRITADLRKQLIRNLESQGLSKRAAEEALGTDPRDLEIKLRALLQTSASSPFSARATRLERSVQDPYPR